MSKLTDPENADLAAILLIVALSVVVIGAIILASLEV